MSKPIGVIRFPGTNCDFDVFRAVEEVGHKAIWLWHRDIFDPASLDGIILPGGFSYGDYLRSGALAARSAVMLSVREAAKKGLPILGICNGFQILCEAKLLPGVLTRNNGLRFIDDWVELKPRSTKGIWAGAVNQTIRLPIAHGDGCYYAESGEIAEIVENGQVLCTYAKNVNGSLMNIAGIINEVGNVCALMPHPERAIQPFHGCIDGRKFFEVFQ